MKNKNKKIIIGVASAVLALGIGITKENSEFLSQIGSGAHEKASEGVKGSSGTKIGSLSDKAPNEALASSVMSTSIKKDKESIEFEKIYCST